MFRRATFLTRLMLVLTVGLIGVGCPGPVPAAPPPTAPPPSPTPTSPPEPTATPVPEPTPTPAPVEPAVPVVQVRMSEFKFEPAEVRLQAGQPARIEFINEGAIEHEVVIGRQLKLEAGKPAGYEEDFFEWGALPVETSGEGFRVGSPEEIEEEGWHVEIEPGGKVLVSFTVPADRTGEWEVGCLIPGHYEAGMKGTLIVE